MRLHADRKAAKYSEMIYRDLNPANLRWSVLKNIEEQWDALVERKYSYDPIVPNITKGISVPKCLESFYLYLGTVVGKRGIPLYYMVSNLAALSGPATPPEGPYPTALRHSPLHEGERAQDTYIR